MNTLDDLLELKRLRDNPAFKVLATTYSVRIERMLNQMLEEGTEDPAALRLKWGIHHMRKVHPEKMLDSLIKSVESQIEKAHAQNTK